MDILGDRRIRLSQGEVVTVHSEAGMLSLDRPEPDSVKQVISITAPPVGGKIVVHALAASGGAVTLTSSTGANWKTVLPSGGGVFEFVVEPRPDEYYCSLDPLHPVSKSDTTCPQCGSLVIHG